MTLKAFHGSQEIKDKYLKRVKMHMDADEIVRGIGYEPGYGSGKGKMCAIGCTLEAYNHALYETELGIPKWLALLEDDLFENMSEAKSRTWPHEFLSAINPGCDLERIKGPFLIIVLKTALKTFDHQAFPDVKSAIEGSIALWQRDDIGSDDWDAARCAAWDAASAATWDAEASAEWAAEWVKAADAASDTASYAARYAAWAHADGPASADAWAAKYDYLATQIIGLMKAEPANQL